MIEFGKTLREARERRGMTIAQVAETTRIMSQIIEGLENENFSKIVAPIYGRGFVKLYCEAVGIDPKPLVMAFMDHYNGNVAPKIEVKDVRREELPTPPPPVPPTPPAPQPIPAPSPAQEEDIFTEIPAETPKTIEQDIFDMPNISQPRPIQMQAATPKPIRMPAMPTSPMPTTASTPRPANRYATPVDDMVRKGEPVKQRPRFKMPEMQLPQLPAVPKSFWRMAILAIGAIVFIMLVWSGIRSLYRVTMTNPEEAVNAVTEQAEQKEEKAPAPAVTKKANDSAAPKDKSAPAKPVKQRTPTKVKPLYID